MSRRQGSSALLRRQKDVKRGLRFTIMVCGCPGTGKTTFINSILDQNILPHRYHYENKSKDQAIPKTITFANLNGTLIDASEYEKNFNPEISNREPGIAITETSVEIIDEDDSKLLLSIIDTPGFGENLDNEICCQELVQFLEQQFDLVLAEETRVRRNPRFEDTRVHVCLYFITPTGHGLRELDIETMKKLSKFVNVIPIIGRADSFTQTELINFKRNIMEDIDKYNIPIFQFTYDEEEDDEETIEESRYLSQLQPFALISSEIEGELNGKMTRIRKYPWGSIDINNTEISDFPILKSVLLGSHLQDLKDITHDFLYEAYRTEKLLNVSDLKEFDDFNNDNNYENGSNGVVSSNGVSGAGIPGKNGKSRINNINNYSEAPSMSNLADIANSKSMARFDAVVNGQHAADTSVVTAETTKYTNLTDSNNVHENNNNNNDDDGIVPNSAAIENITDKLASSALNSTETSNVNGSEVNGKNTDTTNKTVTNNSTATNNNNNNNEEDPELDHADELSTKDSENNSIGLSRPPIPNLGNTTPRSAHSPSVSSSNFTTRSPVSSSQRNQIRKISETIPYILRHETLLAKQQKLQELEKQSAQELAKRAAELERKAMELKLREKTLRQRLEEKSAVASIDDHSIVDSIVQSPIQSNQE